MAEEKIAQVTAVVHVALTSSDVQDIISMLVHSEQAPDVW